SGLGRFRRSSASLPRVRDLRPRANPPTAKMRLPHRRDWPRPRHQIQNFPLFSSYCSDTREMRLAPCCVNQIFPSEAAVIPIGFASLDFIGINSNVLRWGSKITRRLPPLVPRPPPSVSQILPLVSLASLTGSDFSAGIVNSCHWPVRLSNRASFPA